jgi:hypothetical protein
VLDHRGDIEALEALDVAIPHLSCKVWIFAECFFNLREGTLVSCILRRLIACPTRPNRSSRARSTTGAKSWVTPSVRASWATYLAISWTSCNSQLDVSLGNNMQNTYLSVEGAAIRNRRIEDCRVANQETMNTYRRSTAISIGLESYVSSAHTLRLDNRRNSKCRVLHEIILSSLDIGSNPIPRNRVANWKTLSMLSFA